MRQLIDLFSFNRSAMLKNDNYYFATHKQIKADKEKKRQEELKKQEERIKKQQEIIKKDPTSNEALKILALRKRQQTKKNQAELQAELAYLNSISQPSSLLSFVSENTQNADNELSISDIRSLLESKRKKKSNNPTVKLQETQPKKQEAQQPNIEKQTKSNLELTAAKSQKDISLKKQNEDDENFDDIMEALKASSLIQSEEAQNKQQPTIKPFSKLSIFKPKSNLQLTQLPQKKIDKKEPFKSRDQLERERRKQQKKMKAELSKLQEQINPKKDGEKAKMENSEDDADQKKQNKTNRKIKKSMNYQALDLKRKYKDKFVGGMRENQRKYTKNGVLKPQYRMNKELQIQNGQVNNIYEHSLSKSFFIEINLGSDSESQEEHKIIEIPSVEESSEQKLTALIKEMFGFQKFREGQYEVIKNIMNHQSTIFVSETASGKSLTYIISSIIMARQFEGMSIVISPLIALMLDQLDHLPYDLPAACISSLINYEQRQHILNMIKEKKVKLLFITPEMLLTDILFHLKQFPPINFVCIDQAHCLSQLSHNFRTSYIALSEIIKNHVVYNTPDSRPNVLCLTATANTQTIESLSKKLDIKQIIKSSSTLNKNLYITISRQIRAQNKYKALVQYLSTNQIMKCEAVLIYCRAKYLLENVFNFLSNSGISASVFHGSLEHKEKTRIITQFKNKNIRIIISTTALGMGLDFEHLDCIVHFNMAKSLESYVQQIGRAGRRKNRAYCHLFLDESDFFMERNYILADQLEEKSMKAIVDQIEKSQSAFRRKNTMKEAKKSKTPKKEVSAEEMQRVVNRAVLAIEKIENEEENSENFGNPFEDSQLSNEQNNQNPLESEQISEFAPLYYMNVKELAQKTTLREQALLIILMKTAEVLNRQLTKNSEEQIIRILPLSNEVLKLSFFRSNEKELVSSEKFGDFYRKLVDMDLQTMKATSKKVNGAYHIPLIERCNQMKVSPIQLMSMVYEITNEYAMKVEFLNEVYVFSIRERKDVRRKQVNQKLNDRLFQQGVINMVNEVQNMSMTKLEVFYSLAFDHSQIRVEQIIKKKLIIDRSTQIPSNNIMNEITKYFNTDINSFYSYLAGTSDELERQMFLPTQTIEPSETNNVYEHVKLFFKHMYSNLRDNNNKTEVIKRKEALVEMYKDGKVITRVFLGVNDEKSSRAIYGEHTYWRQFIKKKYFCLLKVVREHIEKYKQDLLDA